MKNYFNASLRNLAYRLRKFKDIIDEELKNEILKNKDVICDMIRSQLYDLGIEGRGISIASYQPYSTSTIKKKIKKGQPTNRVTLRDTGEFYRHFYIVFDADGFYIDSDDKKTKSLVEKYGRTIFRLTDANFSILLNNYIKPSLKQKMEEQINGSN